MPKTFVHNGNIFMSVAAYATRRFLSVDNSLTFGGNRDKLLLPPDWMVGIPTVVYPGYWFSKNRAKMLLYSRDWLIP